jgi:hypothetical protein
MSTALALSPEIGVRIGVDLLAVSVLMFGLYYRRYRDKELTTAASMFNVFVFAVLAILQTSSLSKTAGFGLFAILALFTLRSEPITKLEIAYFFASISIAVVCSIQTAPMPLVIIAVMLVLLGAYVIDHPRILRSVGSLKITLDRIEKEALADSAGTCKRLSQLLGVQVLSYQIIALDYINDTARANVYFRKL